MLRPRSDPKGGRVRILAQGAFRQGDLVLAGDMENDPSDGRPIDFEQTLAALLKLMGARVEVTLFSSEPRALVATFHGELARGGDIHHPSREGMGEAFIFSLTGPKSSSFVLEERMFARACGVHDAPGTVRVYLLGGLVLQVDPVESD